MSGSQYRRDPHKRSLLIFLRRPLNTHDADNFAAQLLQEHASLAVDFIDTAMVHYGAVLPKEPVPPGGRRLFRTRKNTGTYQMIELRCAVSIKKPYRRVDEPYLPDRLMHYPTRYHRRRYYLPPFIPSHRPV